VGTNYYLRLRAKCRPACSEHCHGPEIHLGKQSAGWVFQFRAYPDGIPGISGPVTNYEQWRNLLNLDGIIHADDGTPVSPIDLLTVIAHHTGGRTHPSRKDYTDDAGRVFIPEEFK
jgi:hypothetical protein